MLERDWGADTLDRFRYQAEVTLPYCLAVVTRNKGILAVLPEHLEDIALQTDQGWRFLQVKSRNPERGLWTATDLLVKKGGALRSLYRTYRLTEGKDYPLEIVLEGAIKTNDSNKALRPNEDRSPLLSTVMERLKVKRAVAEDFLRRVVLDESSQPRSSIQATNRQLLHELAPSLTLPELEALHTSFLAEIDKAMRCEPLSSLWPRSVTHPARRSRRTAERLRAKTLDLQRLSRIAGPLSGTERPLLQRIVASGSGPITILEQKLLRGGAPPSLIERARTLRANAQHFRFEMASQQLRSDDAKREDLHERLLTYAQTAHAVHEASSRPAVGMWADLLEKFNQSAGNIDRHNLVHADPMILMGESCILSDRCEFNWGDVSNVTI